MRTHAIMLLMTVTAGCGGTSAGPGETSFDDCVLGQTECSQNNVHKCNASGEYEEFEGCDVMDGEFCEMSGGEAFCVSDDTDINFADTGASAP
jgi:pentose-5-phosphate-3-epimerase